MTERANCPKCGHPTLVVSVEVSLNETEVLQLLGNDKSGYSVGIDMEKWDGTSIESEDLMCTNEACDWDGSAVEVELV